MDDSQILLTDSELIALQPMARKMSLSEGDVVFRRGEPGTNMYAVVDGALELRFGEGKAAKKIGPGAFFGELAVLMADTERTADAVALETSQIAAWDRSAIQRLKESSPAVILDIVMRSCGYLLASEETLISKLQSRNEELQRALDYLRRTREELTAKEILAHSDPLTKLYNRRCMDKQLPKFAQRARKTGSILVLLMGDLDGFKAINDQCGHAVGDAMLIRVAELISAGIRRTDLACRMGGDEFVVILPDVRRDEASTIATRLVERMNTLTSNHKDVSLPLTLSLGAVVYRSGEDLSKFVARADTLLYEAKAQGGARVVWETLPV